MNTTGSAPYLARASARPGSFIRDDQASPASPAPGAYAPEFSAQPPSASDAFEVQKTYVEPAVSQEPVREPVMVGTARPESMSTQTGSDPAVHPGALPNLPTAGKETMIYIALLGEGLNMLRSVRAEHVGRDFYKIIDSMPEGEAWEYQPGQVVRCKKKTLSSGKALVAIEEAPRAQ